MKHIKLILLASLFAFSLHAQTVVDSLSAKTGLTTVSIQPIQLSMLDTTRAVGLGVRIVYDDLKSDCLLLYQVVDSLGNNLRRGNIEVTGSDYTNWTGDNVYPFTYVSGKLKLTLK